MKTYLELFTTFFRISIVSFGGGYSMIPLLFRELVDNRGWISEQELTDYVAVGQCTPGIIAVNIATFVGHKRKGLPGALLSTAGFITPCLIIITIVAMFINNISDYPAVKNAMAGLRACVCVLILDSVLRLFKTAVTDGYKTALFAVIFVIAVFTDISTIILVISAGIAGFLICLAKKAGAK